MTTAGERQSAVARLRAALSGLPDEADEAPSRLRAVPGREPRPRAVNQPECRTTRASIHDYLSGRLLPYRRRRLEAHLDGCAECIRSFTDVREASWRHRDLDGRRAVVGDDEGGRHRRALRRHITTATG